MLHPNAVCQKYLIFNLYIVGNRKVFSLVLKCVKKFSVYKCFVHQVVTYILYCQFIKSIAKRIS